VGSYSATWHLTQVKLPRQTPARQAGTYWFTYPIGMKSWVDLGGWLHTEISYLSAHPSRNRAWCRATELIKTNLLTTTPRLLNILTSGLIIPHSRLSHCGSHSFAVCGHADWSSIPAAAQYLSWSSYHFCRLKTELLNRPYSFNSLGHICDSFDIKMGECKLSYLLTCAPSNSHAKFW